MIIQMEISDLIYRNNANEKNKILQEIYFSG